MLNPETPLFREPRYLLAEEPELRDTALYLSVLGAVADGNSTRGGIANYLERKAPDIAHPLNVLEDVGLLFRDADIFRNNRSTFRIAEPLIRFYHAIMRPVWDQLERPGSPRTGCGEPANAGSSAMCSVRTSNKPAGIGPCITLPTCSPSFRPRSGTGWFTMPLPKQFRGGCRGGRYTEWWQATTAGDRRDKMERDHGRRTYRAPAPYSGDLARGGRYDTGATRLLCFSGSEFNDKARAAARSDEVALIDLATLYQLPH
ncbi:AAA family ATPase [Nocardia aobensis]|uniref:AAA family ATPase n=1 Tax=Nocardia aobensis TaxID=257277 RepID=UPI0002EED372|nr:hypothetical protein [Nocardia aobensis]